MSTAKAKTPEFTPEAVRAALLAADVTEHENGKTTGFFIGDGRESLGEILIEVRRHYYGSGEVGPWTDRDKEQMQDLLWGYTNNLRAAGYPAQIKDRMVIVTAKEAGQ